MGDVIPIDRLDANQQWLIDQLKSKVEWHVGSAWVLESKRVTVNVLDVLVERGLVEKRRLKRQIPGGRGRNSAPVDALTDVYVVKGYVFKRAAEKLAHGCTHLQHPDECCPGRGVCNHGVGCSHGSCCWECYHTKCPSGVADEEEAALRSLRFHQEVGSAPEWQPVVTGEDGGGTREFLDGKPISCGTYIELQAREFAVNHNGDEGHRRLDHGILVRFEIAWSPVRRPMMHAEIGGHEFAGPIDPWMRFRWPRRKR